MTTPTIAPVNADSSTVVGPNLVPHQHNFNSIVGLRFGTDGRVEPVYDSANVYANGQVIALYNASSTPGVFSSVAVPIVTVVNAVKNVEGDEDNTAGKVQADRFLAEGRITAAEHKELTTTPTPKTAGVAASRSRPADRPSAAVIGDITFATKLTPSGFTLGQAIKNVTFPRTLAQLADNVRNLPVQNVVNNLAALALNILEPIKAKYPNMLITNTYRHGPGQAQHGTGQAADLQFRGVGAHSYFEIAAWIEKNIPYDQLLLEYLPGKTVWIHISYAIPNLPYGGTSVRASKPINRLATLNGAAGGKFTVNLHSDIIVAAVPNRVVAA
jgi:hypothetical protein